MHFLILLGLMIAISVVSALLSKPKAPGLTTVSPPTTSPGTPIPVLFGRAKIAGNVIWFGGFKVHPINQYTDFGLVKVQIGRNYSISMAVALCMGPIDVWYDIIADTGQRFTEMPPYTKITGFSGDAFSGFTETTAVENVITLDHSTMPFDVGADMSHGGDGVVLATIYNPNLYGGKFGQSGVSGPIRFYAGRRSQPANAYWGSFPLASIPGISYSIDAGGNVTIDIFFRRDIASVRWAVSTVAPPSDGDVLGGTLISAAPWSFTFSALTSGQTLFVGILGFNTGGTPSPLASFSITWSGSPQTGAPVATGSAGSTEPAPPYPNLSYAVFEDTMIGQSVYPRPLYFEVGRTPAPGFSNFPSNVSGDVNPLHIIYDLLTDPLWGVGLTTDDIDVASWAAAAATVGDVDQLYLSYLLSQQQPAQQVVDEILRTIDGVRYTDPLTGKFGIKLIRADYTVGSLATFDESNIESLDFTQAGWRETVNEVKVSFTDRARDYQTNQVAAQDLAGIMATGRVATHPVSYPGVTTEDLALRLAQRDLRALALPLAKATMKVNREAFDLHEGSPFLLTYADYGVSQMVMRVMTITRAGRDEGMLTVECVQDTFSLPESPAYATSGVTWDDPVAPGSIQVPEVTPVSDQNTTTGALALQIDDPDNRITMVQFQHQSGHGTMTPLAVASPPYHDQVTLDPKYPSVINYVVTYATQDGSLDTITGSQQFSVEEKASALKLTPSISSLGTVQVRVESVGSDTVTAKLFGLAGGAIPTDTQVRSDPTPTTVPGVWDSGVILAPGQIFNVGAFGYDNVPTESIRSDTSIVGPDPFGVPGQQPILLETFDCDGRPSDLTDPSRGSWSKSGDTGTDEDWVVGGGPPWSPFGCIAVWGTTVPQNPALVISASSVLERTYTGLPANTLILALVDYAIDKVSAGPLGVGFKLANGTTSAESFGTMETAAWSTLAATLATDGSGNLTVSLEVGPAGAPCFVSRKPAGALLLEFAVYFDNLRFYVFPEGMETPGQGEMFGLVFEFGDDQTAPTVGAVSGKFLLPFAANILGATIVGDPSGSAEVDVQTAAFADPPVFTSIAGSDLPTLSSQGAVQDNTLGGWTTSITAGTLIQAVLNSLTTCKKVTVTLTCIRS